MNQRVKSEIIRDGYLETGDPLTMSRKGGSIYIRRYKRILDLIVSTAGIIISAPLLLIISAAIKMSSRGKIIFSQVRIGKDGKPFTFYKFRTMNGSEHEDGDRKERMISYIKSDGVNNNIKIESEERITGIGKLLRRTSLDELPQLINVLRGEMTIVGPRPCLPYEYDQYDDFQRKRLTVMPGCTGVWQTTNTKEISFQESILLDMYYIRNISFRMDLLLILKTIPIMILGRGRIN